MCSMQRFLSLFAGLLLAAAAPAAAAADQRTVFELVESGEIMRLEDILRIVRPQVAGTFISADLDVQSRIYRLRFMNNGDVVNVDVNAKTGARLSRGHY